jgi:hypothetical protein
MRYLYTRLTARREESNSNAAGQSFGGPTAMSAISLQFRDLTGTDGIGMLCKPSFEPGGKSFSNVLLEFEQLR